MKLLLSEKHIVSLNEVPVVDLIIVPIIKRTKDDTNKIPPPTQKNVLSELYPDTTKASNG